MGVNGVSGNQPTNSTKLTFVPQDNGTYVVNFKGQKYTLTPKQVESYNETFAAMTYTVTRINDIEAKLAVKGLGADEKTKLEKELADMKELHAKQTAAASYEISPNDGSVTFNLKKDMNVEEFKNLFFIDDGAFRSALKKEALQDGIYAGGKRTYTTDGEVYSGYDDAWMAGVTEFENGVKLIEDGDGRYYPDYSGVTLQQGANYTIAGGKVEPPKEEGILGWGFWGL